MMRLRRRGYRVALSVTACIMFCIGLYGAPTWLGAGLPRALSTGATGGGVAVARAAVSPAGRVASVRAHISSLPLGFEAVGGHGSDGVRFQAHGGGYGVYLTARDAVLTLGSLSAHRSPGQERIGTDRTALLRFHLLGSTPDPRVVGQDRQPGTVSYLSGSDGRAWRRGVPTYAQVLYPQVYPGVGLRYYGTQGQLEYDFRLAPRADASIIRQQVSGTRSMRVASNGDLILDVASGGVVHWARPVAYQPTAGGRRLPVAVRYALSDAHTFGFALGHYNRALPLVIDPVLSYSTFFGVNDNITGIALDRSGAAYITGYTYATIITDTRMMQLNRVPTNCPVGSTNPCPDAFVAKVSPSGEHILYSTYLGGSAADVATSIAVDNSGSAYVAGYTNSLDFPVTAHAFQRTNHGGNDAFISKLSPNGLSLLYSTYLGGSTDNANTVGDDIATGIAVDQGGDTYVTGYTYAYNFPLKGPLQSSLGYGKGTLGVQYDAFVTKFNRTGSSLLYSTYLGGSLSDAASGVAVDGAGEAYVTGQTNSPDFPAPAHALQPQLYGTDFNSFVAKFSASGHYLVYSTYLGRSAADKTHGIAVDSVGNAYVVGETNGGIPRTVGVAQPTSGGGIDAFVAKLNGRGVLVYSTYLGGVGNDIGTAIALNPVGDAYVTGNTASAAFNTPVFPLKGALQGILGGNRGGFGMLDAFVAKVNACGSALLYSSYLGGTFVDGGSAIAVDSQGNAYIGGQTLSPNFPTAHAMAAGAVYAPPTGNGFVARISGSPGNRSGACAPALTLDVAPQSSSTAPLTVTVHTTPYAQVTATVDVTNTVPPATKGALHLGALLYRASVHGSADGYGLYVGAVRLKYVIKAPVLATLRILVHSGRSSAYTTTLVTLII